MLTTKPMPRLLILLAVTVTVLLMPLPEAWAAGWGGELLNRLHAPLFALFGVLLGSRQGWKMLVIVLATAAAVELIQPWFGRSASVTDFGWGMVGAAAAMLWRRGGIRLRFVALAVALAPPAVWWTQVTVAENEAAAQFPDLLGPQMRHSAMRWVRSPPAERVGDGFILQRGSSLRVEVPEDDWSAFEALELEGTLESESPLDLGLRLDIGAGLPNRVRAGATFQPGANRVRVPWPDDARLSPVKQLVLFLGTEGPEARLSLQTVRLLPATQN